MVIVTGCVPERSKSSPLKFAWFTSEQMILVIVTDWHSNQGVLTRYVRESNKWHKVGDGFTVSLGKTGVAWGEGLHPMPQQGPIKKEGDGRSPAGIFSIGSTFGYADHFRTLLPYHALKKTDFCIDDSNSLFYNQIVDLEKFPFLSSYRLREPMRRDLYFNGDQLYKIGFVIKHNDQAEPGKGSCIFAHLRAVKSSTTLGCTAMDEKDMGQLLLWLNPKFHPVFVLLPFKIYQNYKKVWDLPKIN